MLTATQTDKDFIIDALNVKCNGQAEYIRLLEMEISELQKQLAAKPVPVLPAPVKKVVSKTLNEMVFTKVAREVCKRRNLTVKDLKGRSRKRPLVEARQICMYLIREFTPLSVNKIGLWFNRDHTTVLHGINTINDLMVTDDKLKEEIEKLIEKVYPQRQAA